MATPLALFVAGLAGLLAARKALEPLTVLTQSAAAISADSLAERRLPIPQTKDELQALALAFNATLDRLAAAFARQRRFTADASHELRTPVTAILGQAELALSRPRTPEAYQETLVRVQSEAERMQRLIGRLLTLARAESGQQILDFAPTDVSALLHTLTGTLASESEAKGVGLHLHTPPSADHRHGRRQPDAGFAQSVGECHRLYGSGRDRRHADAPTRWPCASRSATRGPASIRRISL